MIPLKVHNVIDYIIGFVLVAVPFVFGFNEIAVARNLFLVAGFGLIGYSLLTNYPYSLAKVIPLGAHMTLDVLVGLLVILGPALFDYRPFLTGGQYALHWVLGLGAMGLVVFTREKKNAGVDRFRTYGTMTR